MSDAECNGILSCDCGTDNGDSPERLLRLSNTDKLNQIAVSRNLFFFKYNTCVYDTLCDILDYFH